MVLIRKIEKAARDTPTLQRIECSKALIVGNAKVMPAVDDQHGGLPLLDKVDRVLLFVALRVLPVRPALLPLREPELFGAVVHHPLVEGAVMGHQAAEAV